VVLLRVVSSALVMWSSVRASVEWVLELCVPVCVRECVREEQQRVEKEYEELRNAMRGQGSVRMCVLLLLLVLLLCAFWVVCLVVWCCVLLLFIYRISIQIQNVCVLSRCEIKSELPSHGEVCCGVCIHVCVVLTVPNNYSMCTICSNSNSNSNNRYSSSNTSDSIYEATTTASGHAHSQRSVLSQCRWWVFCNWAALRWHR